MYVELHAVLFLRAAAFLQQYKKILSAGNLVVVKNLYFRFLHLFYKTELTGTTNKHTYKRAYKYLRTAIILGRMLEKFALVLTSIKVFFQRLKMENIHALIITGCANIRRGVFFMCFKNLHEKCCVI